MADIHIPFICNDTYVIVVISPVLLVFMWLTSENQCKDVINLFNAQVVII